jgi:hypothetical protein
VFLSQSSPRPGERREGFIDDQTLVLFGGGGDDLSHGFPRTTHLLGSEVFSLRTLRLGELCDKIYRQQLAPPLQAKRLPLEEQYNVASSMARRIGALSPE